MRIICPCLKNSGAANERGFGVLPPALKKDTVIDAYMNHSLIKSAAFMNQWKLKSVLVF